MTMAKTALILAGHGSHLSPETAGIVWAQVDKLRTLGVADEVTAAFWKETPSFHGVLATLAADDVTVLPLFTAQGYFTQTVIPAEMALTGPVTQRDGRTIRYAQTLSEHPRLTEIVRERVSAALAQSGATPADVAVALIGHGTRRSAESRQATQAQADAIRDLAAETLAVYLDDTPAIPDIYQLTARPVIIAVPFFLALGSHTTRDVPAALGLAPGATSGQVAGRTVYYTLPVGVGGDLDAALLAIAQAAGAPLRPPQPASTWDGFPTVGRDALIEAVRAAGWIEFGQLTLSLHEVRPTEMDFEHPLVEFNDPAALRTHLRQSPFRPLATTTDLPRDWIVRIEKRSQLHAVVETVYPGLVADWARRATLTPTPLDALAARQTGLYRQISDLPPERRAEAVAQVCGRCVRQPTWFTGAREPLPCAEACSFWLTQALAGQA